MSDVKFKRGSKQSVDSYTGNDGELIVSTDTKELFMVNGNEKDKLSDFVIIQTEAARQNLLNPLSKLYFVEETGNLWYWNASDGWWMLLNQGETRTRVTVNETMPPAAAYGVTLQGGSSGNWTAHGTMMSITEDQYLSSTGESVLTGVATQIAQGSVAFGVYRYNISDGIVYKVATTDIVGVSTTGYLRLPLTSLVDSMITTQNIYYFVVFSDMNGTNCLGVNGTQANNHPYVSFMSANLGDLSVNALPSSFMAESEITYRLYGSLSSSSSSSS